MPDHLQAWWEPSMCCLHSANSWKRHWKRSGVVDVELADDMPDGWKVWLDSQRLVSPENSTEISAVEADEGRYLGYVRPVARRRPEAKLDEPLVSIPFQYTKAPLLRGNL